MGRDRGTAEPRPSAPAAETGTRLTVVVVATVLVLAAIDAAAGPDLVLVGLILVGPCLAAVVGGRREVVAVSALVLALLVLLSWPDQLWWTGEQALYVVVGVSLTALSLVMVRMREESQRRSLAERQRTAALAAIVESSQDAVVGQSFDADITTWNRAAEELYGWRADEVVGARSR